MDPVLFPSTDKAGDVNLPYFGTPYICFFWCSKEQFLFSLVQYLGVTAGIKPATLQCIPGALAY